MPVTEFPADLDRKVFADKAQTIYEQKYKKRLEATEQGKVVGVELESGEAFIGRTVLEAAMKAREKFPERLFYFIRIGYPAVHSVKGSGQGISVQERS